MNDYFIKVKTFANILKIARHLILDEDLMLHVLVDVGSDLVIVNFTYGTTPTT